LSTSSTWLRTSSVAIIVAQTDPSRAIAAIAGLALGEPLGFVGTVPILMVSSHARSAVSIFIVCGDGGRDRKRVMQNSHLQLCTTRLQWRWEKHCLDLSLVAMKISLETVHQWARIKSPVPRIDFKRHCVQDRIFVCE
jgi:hypothetical protein